jgi:hypothetical protein
LENGSMPGGTSVGRWMLVAGGAFLAVIIGAFVWSSSSQRPGPDMSARTIELPNSVLKTHLKTARINGPNFYGLLLPSWDNLSKEKREEYLRTVFDYAKEKGCNQVNLLDSEGKGVGSASEGKIEVIMP